MQNGGIYGSNEWQKDRIRDGAVRVNSLGGCFNELISQSSGMKREKKMAFTMFQSSHNLSKYSILGMKEISISDIC